MDYLLFLSSILLLAVSMCFTPGPNNALAMATGLSRGFKAALPFCLGAGIGANVTLLLLGFGLGEVFVRFPIIYDGLRYAGAVYMLWLAWRISGLTLPARLHFKQCGRDAQRQPQHAARENERQADFKPFGFFQALLFQLANVKVWITNVIIVSNYIGAGEDMLLRLALAVALFTCMGTGAMCAWAAGGVFMGRFLASGGMRRANYVFAAFLVLSIVLLFV